MKSDFKNTKAILFDSGYTLNMPRTGNWFIPPRFFDIVDGSLLKLGSNLYKRAISKAYSFLMKNHMVNTEKEEYLQFREFYSILLKEWKYPYIDDDVIDALAKDNVYNDDKFVFFDDVEKAVAGFSKKFTLGVVSDTWPSLERVFINKGLRRYFSTFMMSSVNGVSKSDKKLFQMALEELGIKPYEAIFIDDSVHNLNIAGDLGMIPVKIDRRGTEKADGITYLINSLSELQVLLS